MWRDRHGATVNCITVIGKPSEPHVLTLYPDDYGVLEISGRDARTFLQAQLATDLRTLAVGTAAPAALLAANGRVLAYGTLIVRSLELYWWLLHRTLIPHISTHLKRYILRSKLAIDPKPELQLAESDSAETLHSLVDSAGRPFGLVQGFVERPLNPHAFALQAVNRGVLDFAECHSDRHLPQALGLQRNGSIALDKGCYPGQEIVARTHYLGRVKRSLMLYTAIHPPTAGQLYDAQTNAVGELLNAVNNKGKHIGLATVQTSCSHARWSQTESNSTVEMTPFD